jgi:hypothetical protein
MATTVTKQQGPFVLATRQSGITVIPAGTPLTRLNYFDGKFLRASDLQAEQDYIRRLVELSNQAGAHGVANGFSVSLSPQGALNVGPGLAIGAGGGVILLPAAVSVDFGELIEKSKSTAGVTAVKPGQDLSAFGDCVTTSEDQPADVITSGDLFIITVAAAEALCGQEDVYGKLCEEACVTSTERPFRVEGVVLRARPLGLLAPLPNSTAQPLDQTHLRSRVAEAYYASERLITANLISAAGLSSTVWCFGAAGDSGSEVPLGVFSRSGAAVAFLDAWIARRERIDTVAKRYWQWRMRMRPWDVFLAQILQFQCQLRDGLTPGGPGGSDDPCKNAKGLLAEASKTVDQVTRFYSTVASRLTEIDAVQLPGGLAQLSAINKQLLQAVQVFGTPLEDRRLIRMGIVGAPSAAYLPVTPGSVRSVNQQVRAWMGEGVDLRFCIVRPDYVAHALEEAQHMDRISLIEGLDDPQKKPRVDVLVPNGEIIDKVSKSPGSGFEAQIQFLPMSGDASSALISTQGAARAASTPGGGGALYAGAVGQVKEAGNFRDLATAFSKLVLARDASQAIVLEKLAESGSPVGVKGFRANPGLFSSINTIGAEARKFTIGRKAGAAPLDNSDPQKTAVFAVAQAGEDQTAALWLEASLAVDPFSMQAGQKASAELRFLTSLPSAETTYTDVHFRGDFFFRRTLPRKEGGVLVEGQLSGVLTTTRVVNGTPEPPEQATGSAPAAIARIPAATGDAVQFVASVQNTSGTLRVEAATTLSGNPLAAKTAISYEIKVSDRPIKITLLESTLEQSEAVLQPGNEFHTAALSGVEVLGAVLADDDFSDTSAGLLFPPLPPATDELEIRATLDWVLFHRRREKKCSVERDVVTVPPRRYHVFHARVLSLADAEALRKALLAGDDAIIKRMGVTPVDLVEFAPGIATLLTPQTEVVTDWKSVQPGNRLIYGAVASQGGAAGDGTQLALSRLSRLEDAIAGVSAPGTNLISEPLPAVPASLSSPGADGAMVLVTMIEEAVKPTAFCAFRPRSTDAEARIREALRAGNLDQALSPDLVHSLGAASFKGTTVEVLDDSLGKVVAQWTALGHVAQIPGVMAAVPKGFLTGADTPEFAQAQAVFVELSKQTDFPAPGLPLSILERTEFEVLRQGCNAILIFRIANQAITGETRRARIVLVTPRTAGGANTVVSDDPQMVVNFAPDNSLEAGIPPAALEVIRTNLRNLNLSEVLLAPVEAAEDDAARARLASVSNALSGLALTPAAPNTKVLTTVTAAEKKLFTSNSVKAKDLVFLLLTPRQG